MELRRPLELVSSRVLLQGDSAGLRDPPAEDDGEHTEEAEDQEGAETDTRPLPREVLIN